MGDTMTGKALQFKSKKNYNKWLAFGHIHGQFMKTPGHQKVMIDGVPHKVKHCGGM